MLTDSYLHALDFAQVIEFVDYYLSLEHVEQFKNSTFLVDVLEMFYKSPTTQDDALQKHKSLTSKRNALRNTMKMLIIDDKAYGCKMMEKRVDNNRVDILKKIRTFKDEF